MSELTGTYTAYAYSDTAPTLTNIVHTEVIHRPPSKGEITLRVCATALNPMDTQLAGISGIDKVAMNWVGGRNYRKGEDNELAGRIPGADVSGVIVAIGEGVVRWKIGDKVFGFWLSPVGLLLNFFILRGC